MSHPHRIIPHTAQRSSFRCWCWLWSFTALSTATRCTRNYLPSSFPLTMQFQHVWLFWQYSRLDRSFRYIFFIDRPSYNLSSNQSQRAVRCVCCVTVPTLLGITGRRIAVAALLLLVLEGPVSSIVGNTEKTVEMNQCFARLRQNISQTRRDFKMKPFLLFSKKLSMNLNLLTKLSRKVGWRYTHTHQRLFSLFVDWCVARSSTGELWRFAG